MKRQTVLSAIATVVALTFAPSVPGATGAKAVPDVTVHAADHSLVPLARFKGQVVLIDFWASWCPPCKTSFPALDALSREFEHRGVQVLAVNVDERRRDADAFLDTHPHSMTVLFDSMGAAPLAFGVRGMPSSFLVDRSGTIRFSHIGYTGDVGDQYRRELNTLLSER
jgi:thiol-disulfide isomerase/thioredoxin